MRETGEVGGWMPRLEVGVRRAAERVRKRSGVELRYTKWRWRGHDFVSIKGKGRLHPLTQWPTTVVNKATAVPEPATCTQRPCRAVRPLPWLVKDEN